MDRGVRAGSTDRDRGGVFCGGQRVPDIGTDADRQRRKHKTPKNNRQARSTRRLTRSHAGHRWSDRDADRETATHSPCDTTTPDTHRALGALCLCTPLHRLRRRVVGHIRRRAWEPEDTRHRVAADGLDHRRGLRHAVVASTAAERQLRLATTIHSLTQHTTQQHIRNHCSAHSSVRQTASYDAIHHSYQQRHEYT